MFRNYLKIAIRNLTRHKGFSIINIAGLTLGIAGCLLIGLYVWDEMQYDRFHKDGDRVFRVYNVRTTEEGTGNQSNTPPMFALSLKQQYPEVEESIKLMNIYEKTLMRTDKAKAYEDKGVFAEAPFFSFFTLPIVAGNPVTALSDPGHIVISEDLAKKYFQDGDALNKTIYVGNDTFQVSAIVRFPEHFHLGLSYILPFKTVEPYLDQERLKNWVWQQFHTYIKLKKGANAELLESKFQKYVIENVHPITKKTNFSYVPYFQNVQDIHLDSAGFRFDIAKQGNRVYVNALSIIAVFVLLIACFNFINLSTARSLRRAKEVGIRKVAGANKKQLWFQFTGESVLLALVATIIATGITVSLLPQLNQFTDKKIEFNPFTNPLIGLIILSLGILTGVLAGIYPALFISGFKAIESLKKLRAGGRSDRIHLLRKGLVVVQFGLSVFLIVSTFIVYRQVNYLQNKDLGFNKDQLMYFGMRGDKMYGNQEAFKNEILASSGVISATIGYGLPGDIFAGDQVIVPGPGGGKTFGANQFMVDHDYIKTMGLKIIAGRDFSREMKTDADNAFIINESAVKELGLGTPETALGRRLDWPAWVASGDSLKKATVIGVVKDFHINSLHQPLSTVILQIYPSENWKVAVKLKSENISQTIANIEKVWNKFSPEYPINYSFLDENFAKMYRSEQKLSALLWIFTGMAVFIGCLGLLGLATYAAEQRVKEIGIRKVLGASVGSIISLLSKEFILLLLISFIVAFPIAWWAMKSWLADFAYRLNISWWIFAGAAIIALLVAMATISFQAIKAAIANPVKALRSE